MKKLLLLLCFYSQLGFAQADFTRVYHPIINEAELAIVDTSYYDALQFYNEAFANVDKPFAKDYYNAAICASMIGKMSVAFNYLEKIIEKGYLVEHFRKDAFFKYVADTCKKWTDFEKNAQLIQPSFNVPLRDSIQNLHRQRFSYIYAPLTADLRRYYKENLKEKKWIALDSLVSLINMPANLQVQIDSLSKLNEGREAAFVQKRLQKALNLIDLYGYPDENAIGLNPPVASTYTNIFNSVSSYLFENNLISNIFYDTPDKTILLPLLKQAIRDGKAHPYMMRTLLSYSVDEPFTMGKVLVVQLRLENNLDCPNDNWAEKKEHYYWKKERSGILTESEINEKRQSIGLENLEDAYKKAFFKARPTPFLIYGGNYQAELAYIPNCELINKTISGAIVVR